MKSVKKKAGYVAHLFYPHPGLYHYSDDTKTEEVIEDLEGILKTGENVLKGIKKAVSSGSSSVYNCDDYFYDGLDTTGSFYVVTIANPNTEALGDDIDTYMSYVGVPTHIDCQKEILPAVESLLEKYGKTLKKTFLGLGRTVIDL